MGKCSYVYAFKIYSVPRRKHPLNQFYVLQILRKCCSDSCEPIPVTFPSTFWFLISGSRFNALHVAARANNASIAKYICETVKSLEFMNKLYGSSSALSNLADRGAIMLDLYLNTPDKGSNETPLHFASKLGALEVVRVLVS